MQNRKVNRLISSTVLILMLAFQSSMAEEQARMTQELRKAPKFFALPMELDFDSGAANGDAAILRIMPLYTFPVFDNWKLVNLNIITLADAPGLPAFPGQPGNENATGLSDLLHASFYTPAKSGNFIWGVGGVLAVPTATDDALGSGKWAAGPAFRLAYSTGKWSLGTIVTQRWSFAGDSDRAEVNQLLMRGAIRRQLPNNWFFVSAPIIVANWNAPGEKWLVPVGGGFGRTFRFNDHPWAWSIQGYGNAIKPDAAPDWVVRFAVVAAIPFGDN